MKKIFAPVKNIKKLPRFLRAHLVWSGIGALVVVGIAVGIVSHFHKAAAATLVVRSGDFVQQVSVAGKVTAAQDVNLSFSQSGRVAGVYVKVGDVVRRGQTLASVENGDLAANVAQQQAALQNQQIKLQALKDGTRPEQIAVTQSSVDAANVALAQANQGLVDALQNSFTASEDAINKTDEAFVMPQTSAKLGFFVNNFQTGNSLTNDRLALELMFRTWNTALTGLTPDANLDVAVSTSRTNLAQMKAFLDELSGALNDPNSYQYTYQSSAPIPTTWKADVAAARSSVSAALSAVTSATTAQRSARSTLATAQNSLKLAQAGATGSDIAAQEAQVRLAQANVAAAQAQLGKTVITAPFNGTVTNLDAHVGQIAVPNTGAISLIGTNTLQIESYIPEIHVAQVKVGDAATATLDAYGDGVPFAATVASIDPAETIRDGVSTYRAILAFDAPDDRIKSGMTAIITVVTEKKQNVIAVPQGIVREHDGAKFVTILLAGKGNKTEERKVETGSVSSLGQVEITSGLNAGDTVVINASSTAAAK